MHSETMHCRRPYDLLNFRRVSSEQVPATIVGLSAGSHGQHPERIIMVNLFVSSRSCRRLFERYSVVLVLCRGVGNGLPVVLGNYEWFQQLSAVGSVGVSVFNQYILVNSHVWPVYRMYVANNEWVLVIYWYIYASNGSLNVRYISVLVMVWWLYRSVRGYGGYIGRSAGNKSGYY